MEEEGKKGGRENATAERPRALSYLKVTCKFNFLVCIYFNKLNFISHFCRKLNKFLIEREREREREREKKESIVRKTLLLIVEIVFVFCFHFWSSETVGYSILLTCSNTLDNITQGPHHVAKKSMTMVFSLLDIATSSSWVVSFCTCDKKKRKQNKKQFKKQQERLGSSKTIKQFSSSSTSTF